MADQAVKHQGLSVLKLLLAATGITIVVSLIMIVLPLAYKSLFDFIQFLWPVLAILLLLWIYRSSTDKNIRHFAFFFGISLVPWAITILLWEILLPMLYNDATAYYVSGFGFLACYMILFYGLYRLVKSGQWRINPSTNMYIDALAVILLFAIVSFIVVNMKPGSSRLLDVLILMAYLIADIAILNLCSKLINMNMGVELKYLVFVATEFVLINSIGDFLYELRWLLPLKSVLWFSTSEVTDLIYNASLMFMVAALAIYNSRMRDLTLAEMRNKLDDTRLFVDDIFANAPDLMFICDPEGRVTLVNEPLLKLFKVTRPNIIGKMNVFDHVNDKVIDDRVDISNVKEGKTVSIPRIDIRLAGDGRPISLSIKLFPTFGAGGAIQHYVGIMEDITERICTEEALLDSKRQIELYLDLMGHDINNMNQIGLGFLEMAQEQLELEGRINADSALLIYKPLESFKNSSRLISNVRKIQSIRKNELRLEPLDAGILLSEAVEEQKVVKDRDITVNYTLTTGLIVKANDLLKDVFTNLIRNAIVHSPPDRPLIVDVKVEPVTENRTVHYRFIVEDNGPGIDDRRKMAIFDRMALGPDKAKGHGLGLFLVRSLVESFGGQVQVEDRAPGDHTQGSRFVVQLPAASLAPGGA